jgi:hypothetical protein
MAPSINDKVILFCPEKPGPLGQDSLQFKIKLLGKNGVNL